MDKVGQFGHSWTIRIKLNNFDGTILTILGNFDKIGQSGQNWTIRIKLDSLDKVGQFGKNWTIRKKLDNSDKIGHLVQYWTIRRRAKLIKRLKLTKNYKQVRGNDGRSIEARDDTRA